MEAESIDLDRICAAIQRRPLKGEARHPLCEAERMSERVTDRVKEVSG